MCVCVFKDFSFEHNAILDLDIWFVLVLRDINYCNFLNAKSSSYIYIYMCVCVCVYVCMCVCVCVCVCV